MELSIQQASAKSSYALADSVVSHSHTRLELRCTRTATIKNQRSHHSLLKKPASKLCVELDCPAEGYWIKTQEPCHVSPRTFRHATHAVLENRERQR
ncbi:unnamed protein product [Parajaminaea phylloscopi]